MSLVENLQLISMIGVKPDIILGLLQTFSQLFTMLCWISLTYWCCWDVQGMRYMSCLCAVTLCRFTGPALDSSQRLDTSWSSSYSDNKLLVYLIILQHVSSSTHKYCIITATYRQQDTVNSNLIIRSCLIWLYRCIIKIQNNQDYPFEQRKSNIPGFSAHVVHHLWQRVVCFLTRSEKLWKAIVLINTDSLYVIRYRYNREHSYSNAYMMRIQPVLLWMMRRYYGG